jgi:mono/diheme cytochrome c family protein
VRRPAVIAAVLLGAVVVAGCGAEGVATPTPKTVIGATPTTTTPSFPIVPAFKLKGDATKGKTIFLSNCGSCHTLAAAGTTGTVGPNLDTFTPKPDYRAVTAQVTNGGAVMPPFKSSLSTQQIADVAAYVVDSIGGKAP